MMISNLCNKLILIIILSALSILNAQKLTNIKSLKSEFAKRENKEKYYGNLLKNIEVTFSSSIKENIGGWKKALRDAQSIQLRNNFVKKGLQESLTLPIDKNLRLQRITLEVAYSLFPKVFTSKIENIFYGTKDPISFAIATLYLKNLSEKNFDKNIFLEQLQANFGNNSSNILEELRNEILEKPYQLPNLQDLLLHNFQIGKTIIYSFYRKNRTLPGLTIIKKPDGSFAKNSDGSLFHIPQLALSFSNLPSYIPNGNTPQGIYSIVGWYISPTKTIGPTPNILVRSPFEVSTKTFFHTSNIKNNWQIDDYKNLLPKSWQNYKPIYNSFTAGKIGRKLIIIHGSTDEPKYFSKEDFSPLIPTRGCLSSYELWNENTGFCIESDQLKLVNKFKAIGKKEGFLIVIELDNANKSVKIEEIEKIIDQSPQ